MVSRRFLRVALRALEAKLACTESAARTPEAVAFPFGDESEKVSFFLVVMKDWRSCRSDGHWANENNRDGPGGVEGRRRSQFQRLGRLLRRRKRSENKYVAEADASSWLGRCAEVEDPVVEGSPGDSESLVVSYGNRLRPASVAADGREAVIVALA